MSKRQPYGNIKLRGKKSRLLSCGCCVAENRNEECRAREDKKIVYEMLHGYNREQVREQDNLYWDMRENGSI